MGTTSQSGIDFIALEENAPLFSKPDSFLTPAYKDTNGPAIGYGCTFYEDGSKIQYGQQITKKRADQLLLYHVRLNEGYLNSYLNGKNIRLTVPQFDAVVSFVYNAGPGNFLKSQLWQQIQVNPNDLNAIEAAFKSWPYNANRRLKEAQAYGQPVFRSEVTTNIAGIGAILLALAGGYLINESRQ
ncbi:lysozyme [Salmonirosea aquatica]|uniref:Lysozyme n=1 Tax=Salmonirosea aquatica TaxID=2654236 RepID=A0A7C9BGD1_9BACT|nr:glycoside hydrolase family protein [Cytophagaceae bacterium SJW1-29]MPR37156.1 glycoside hydrolase family protein [Cytophagaceae bacterium SJW1-29]